MKTYITSSRYDKNARFLYTEIQKDSNFCLKTAFGLELKIQLSLYKPGQSGNSLKCVPGLLQMSPIPYGRPWGQWVESLLYDRLFLAFYRVFWSFETTCSYIVIDQRLITYKMSYHSRLCDKIDFSNFLLLAPKLEKKICFKWKSKENQITRINEKYTPFP